MSKTRDTGFLANVIQVHDTGVRIMSGSEMLMAISSSGAVTITGELSGSDAANSLLLDGTGSLAFTTTASYNAFSASYGIASASLSSRTTQVEQTYATTGSNTFTGAQYISDNSNAIGFTSTASLYSDGGLRVQGNSFVSGTAYFNNIVVYGTSSIQYITSSQVNISTNIITVNTDTPAIRFGGLSVFDSGSTGLTGSILWDSEKNHWVYSNPSGSTYSGGMFISGPRSSALGSEQGTTSCMLLVGQGSDHLTSSLIYHDSARTCFPSCLVVGAALSGTSATFSSNLTSNYLSSVINSSSNASPLILQNTAGWGSSQITSVSVKDGSDVVGAIGWKYDGVGNVDMLFHSLYNGDYKNTSNVVMVVKGTGNVGIGTTTPSQKLEVYNSSGDTTLKIKNASCTGASRLLINPEGAGAGSTGDGVIFFDMNSTAWVAGVDKSDSSKFKIANDVYGDFRANNYLTVTTSGNVGINMTAPSQKLHVIGGFLQTDGNSSWYRNVFERNVSSWDSVVGFTPGSSPQYTYGYINITASSYVNGTSAGGVNSSRWYYSITNNSISVSVVGTDIVTGSQAPSIRLIVSSGTIYVQVQSTNGSSTAYTTVFVDAMLASGYVNGTYWAIS